MFQLIRSPQILENDSQRAILRRFKPIIVSDSEALSDNIFKKMYQCIYAGDPKSRTQRAIMESALHEIKMTHQQEKRKEKESETFENDK